MRLDKYIAQKDNLSRDQAIELIKAGGVIVNSKIIQKPAYTISDNDNIASDLSKTYDFVSRAGVKLQDALDSFKINVTNKVCLDVGASTGGFTECLLKNGASLVYAVDVGTNQLHPKLISDSRVISFEQTDIRNIDLVKLSKNIDIVTIDVSFISCKKVIPALEKIIRQNCDIILLYKPQFENFCKNLSTSELFKQVDLEIKGRKKSLQKGKSGNQEYLYHLKATVNKT